MLIMMLPFLIPLIAVVALSLTFIQWLIWAAQEEEEPEPTINPLEIRAKAKKLTPVKSAKDLGAAISKN